MSILQLVFKPPAGAGTDKDLVQETDRLRITAYLLAMLFPSARLLFSRKTKRIRRSSYSSTEQINRAWVGGGEGGKETCIVEWLFHLVSKR